MTDFLRIPSPPHLMQRVQEMQRYHQMQSSPSPPSSASSTPMPDHHLHQHYYSAAPPLLSQPQTPTSPTLSTATTTTTLPLPTMSTPTTTSTTTTMPPMPANPLTPPIINIKTEAKICYNCEEPINDPFVIDVSGYPWHAECLRCCVCTTPLEEERTCYVRRNKIYCKEDYFKTCVARCAKCCRDISPSDWVRKAKEAVYHLACFSCDTCDRQLSTGEQFAMLSDQILCREHYMETMEIETGSSDDSVGSAEKKSKRVRTAFTEEQLEVLNRSFEVDNNPDGQDLERIAVSAGLSKRVTQVWFQNSRARQKKHSYQHKRNRPYDLNSQMQPSLVFC